MVRRRFVNAVLVLGALLALLPMRAWAAGPSIRYVPSSTAVHVGDMVNVDIVIDNASDLYAVEVHATFDAARLQVLDDDPIASGIQILPGSMFPRSNPSFIVANQADNSAGTVEYAITLLAPELPLNGSGTLATIRFSARMEGTAQLGWSSTVMATSGGLSIPHTTAGSVIAISQATPLPGKNCTDVIGNGTFEADSHWQMPVTPHKASYTTADKHSGARSVRLGIEPWDPDVYSHSSAYQTIRIPATATSVTLTFWARRFTQDVPKEGLDRTQDLYDPQEVIEGMFDWAAKGRRAQYDWQEVMVLQADCYNWLATLMRERSNDGVWTQYTYDLSAFAGQEIVIYFNVINNGNGYRTWMYVDDVQVEVCEDGAPCAELVRNRSFEWTAEWAHPATPRPADYTTAAAHTGSRSMRHGVVPPTADVYSHSSAYQAIDIPAGALNPVLTFWYKAHSEEPPKSNWKDYDWSSYAPARVIAGDQAAARCCGEVDWQEMLLLDANYQLLSGGVVMRQVRNDGLWRQVTYDLSPYKGMRIVLYFNVINDGNGQRTWMYVDDVSVNLCGNQVHFEPSSTEQAVGATFDMDLVAENIQDLYGVDTTIRFDPAILEVVDADALTPGVQVAVGAWWPGSRFVVANTADNLAGTIRFAATLTAPPPLTGSGELLSIRFHAKAGGETPVALQTLVMVDSSAMVFPVTKSDGLVKVTSGNATFTGRVLLESRTDHSGTLVQLAGGASTTTATDGRYSLVDAAGTYTLTFSHSAFLAHSLVVTGPPGGTVTIPDVTLLAGDINGDGTINILDLVVVASNFGSTTPIPPTADLNLDGIVDIIDIVLVGKNFQP